MTLLRSGPHRGGHGRRSLRLESSHAQLGTVREKGQKEDQGEQDVAGPLHRFKLPPHPSLYNTECTLLLIKFDDQNR
jgi:hypothetical protein